jgi:hypothetical protein
MRPVLSDAKLALLEPLVTRLYAQGQNDVATALRVLLVWQERDKAVNAVTAEQVARLEATHEAERVGRIANQIGDDMLPPVYHDQLAYYADQMAYYAAQIDIYKASIKLAQDTVASVPSVEYAPEYGRIAWFVDGTGKRYVLDGFEPVDVEASKRLHGVAL